MSAITVATVAPRAKCAHFKIIACVDAEFGIGKDNKIPWHNKDDLRWFARKTANSAVIMGRLTYESIGKPLPNRVNIIISSRSDYDSGGGNPISVVSSLTEALVLASRQPSVYVIGGGQLYREAIMHPLCTELILTHMPDSYDCDVKFPFIPPSAYSKITAHPHPDYTLHIKLYKRTNKSEDAYLDLLRRVLEAPQIGNRTDTPTHSLFGEMVKYPLRDEFDRDIIPLFTTKFVPFRIVYEELLWFLRGGTNTDYLKRKNVNIWDANSTPEFLESSGLAHYRPGELGPVYGHQWRRFNADYVRDNVNEDGNNDNVNNDSSDNGGNNDNVNDDSSEDGNNDNVNDDSSDDGGVDQIAYVIESLKTNPLSRRHIVSAWNPQQLDQMALPPCHLMFMFNAVPVDDGDNVGNDGDNSAPTYKLNCHLIMRSNDLFLGHPFNVASYAALTHMIAKICNMTAGELAISITNAHIYANHVDAVKEQMARTAMAYPCVKFSEKIEDLQTSGRLTIDDFESDDVGVVDYHHHGRITAKMVA